MRKRIATIATVLLFALAGNPALAHHGWSTYDQTKPLKLSGTVTEIAYSNPHATLKLEVDGKSWLAVLAPPARMSSRGIASGDIKVGSKATVEGFASKEEAGEMRAERIILEGKTYELR